MTFFRNFHLISADVSQNAIFNIGFIGTKRHRKLGVDYEKIFVNEKELCMIMILPEFLGVIHYVRTQNFPKN